MADSYSILQIEVPSFASVRVVDTQSLIYSVAVGLDGRIFGGTYPIDSRDEDVAGSYLVYDPVTLKLSDRIPLGNLYAGVSYDPHNIVFGSSGKNFFANIDNGELWVFSTAFASYPPPPAPKAKKLLNVSTRALDQSGEDAMIAGFIIQGSDPKKVVIRGMGPSLPVTGALSDPMLELYDSSGHLVTSNDNWISNRLNVLRTQLAPTSPREAAISATLAPGAYTAVVHDSTNQPGLALVEVYDLDPQDSLLANISTRGKVETGDNVMIGGFVVGGADPTKVLVRAIGPSLTQSGVAQPLADPTLELRDSNGRLIASNDNWNSSQQAEITATGLQPKDNHESAILKTLAPGSYTAIVKGQNNTTGVALVEVYNLSPSAK
jgi:hypothetical protein